MRKFHNIDPNTIDIDPRVIFRFEEYIEQIQRSWYLYLLKDDSHLIWASKSVTPADDGSTYKLTGRNILEFPIEGLSWFINTLEHQFFKTEAEGGLVKGKFFYEEIIGGERLCVSRMFGDPGYGFRNYSRQDHLWEDDDEDDPQQADFSDEILFKKGLFNEFKKIANKIDNGDL